MGLGLAFGMILGVGSPFEAIISDPISFIPGS
jgi:hypothetical protein